MKIDIVSPRYRPMDNNKVEQASQNSSQFSIWRHIVGPKTIICCYVVYKTRLVFRIILYPFFLILSDENVEIKELYVLLS